MTPEPISPESQSCSIEQRKDVLYISGPLTLHAGKTCKQALVKAKSIKSIDLSNVTALVTVGAMWLIEAKQKMEKGGHRLSFTEQTETHAILLNKIQDTLKDPWSEAAKPSADDMFTTTGKFAYTISRHVYEVFSLLGEVCVAFLEIFIGKRSFRTNAFVRHIREAGLQAIPIVALISFLMSIVLAYQGVAQLSTFGAQRFSINLVAISTLREMGGLLAAIMVAGRSGSSFTSEIGVMKIREEVDAMSVIGMKPLDVMILPRIAALIVVLPLLTVIAFIAGFFGGALVSITSLGVDFSTYVSLFGSAAMGHSHWVGMVKAPVFALFIGLISCLAGMRVSGSAESVGLQTTSAVVQGIFSVLILDALFSIFFARIGW